ncbi:adenylate/guanylate cyclase domain-containing protein [Mesorhizobium sp. ZC-5]|uniref:adenylate/guanylate cyclase domain-containing protein n=1 Tax=Mesorhizobium sp. ZC-5 TaxID=2986066 RepID=UPI0021E8FB87|nr:adenylate/guanylate cyclase domain-containing protein [Mesorhizobium sp. ZC-5]MCV3243711.1 adenylate/guanylate cyclase domain-containing protein [Mesorhizobium sp. ZC-5]
MKLPGRAGKKEIPIKGDGSTWSRSLQFLLGATMVSLIVLVSAALVGFDYYRARNSAIEDAKAEMRIFSDRLADRFGVLSGQTVTFVGVISSIANAFLVPPPERLDDKIALLREFIGRSAQVDGAYAGYPDGSFFQVVNLKEEGWRKALRAPDDAALAVRVVAVEGDKRTQRWLFLNAAGATIRESPATPTDFDPRTRPWYKAAANIDSAVSIGPYQMATTGNLGMTLAQSHRGNRQIVVGADIILDTITDFLAAERMSADTIAFIVDTSGNPVIHSDRKVMSRLMLTPGEAKSLPPAEPDPLIDSIRSDDSWTSEPRFIDVNGRTFMVLLTPIKSGVLLERHRMAVAAPLDELTAPANRALLQGLVISAGVVAAAIALALLLSHVITKSLERLTESANRLQNLDFATPIEVASHVQEISTLGGAMNRARDAIFTFALYVPKEFVRKSVQAGYFTGRSAKRQEVTALFTDIYDFTTISEGHSPEEVVAMLSEYFDILDEAVKTHEGSIIQFLGDSIFAMWNAPIPDSNHAKHACKAALAAAQSLRLFNDAQVAKGLPEFRTRFGIHTGQAVVGSVGAQERLQYTAMGDTINVASRLEGINKVYGTTILSSAAVEQACRHVIEFRPLGVAQAKGRAETLEVYEVVGARSDARTASHEKLAVPT